MLNISNNHSCQCMQNRSLAIVPQNITSIEGFMWNKLTSHLLQHQPLSPFYNDKPNTTNSLLYCFVMSYKAVILQIFFFYYLMHIITDTGVNGETIPTPTWWMLNRYYFIKIRDFINTFTDQMPLAWWSRGKCDHSTVQITFLSKAFCTTEQN
jgi:hypothetical protein